MILSEQLESPAPTIDLTPVIDMVFLLLIFFLAATTFQQAEREMKIALPHAASAQPIAAAMRELIINVDAQGRIMMGGREVTPAACAMRLAEAIKRNPEQRVAVRGDRAAAYEHIARVLDVCKSSGIQQPFLDTVPLRP